MKILQTILSCLLITLMSGHLVAQEKTKGIIMELVSGEKIEAAQIQNLRTKVEVQTNKRPLVDQGRRIRTGYSLHL